MVNFKFEAVEVWHDEPFNMGYRYGTFDERKIAMDKWQRFQRLFKMLLRHTRKGFEVNYEEYHNQEGVLCCRGHIKGDQKNV